MTRNLLTAFVLAAVVVCPFGCGKKDAPKGGGGGDDHDHGPGPHGGLILEFPAKFHGEFKPDHAKKEATVWILDGKAEKPYRVKAEKLKLVISNIDPRIEIDLLPTDAEADGTASTFVGKHDGLAKEMEYKGTVSGKINDKPYSYDFEEKPAKK